MGLEADLLLELREENKDDGKVDEKQMKKIENREQMGAEEKDDNGEAMAKEQDTSDETIAKENKGKNDDLQVCDKPSCANPANKKCSRFITIIIVTFIIAIAIINIFIIFIFIIAIGQLTKYDHQYMIIMITNMIIQ